MLRIGTQVAVAVLVVASVAAAGAGQHAMATGGTPAATGAGDGPTMGFYVAPGSALSQLRSASTAGEYGGVDLTRRPRVTSADALVVRLRVDGLATAVAARDGNSTTARFFALLASDRASLNGTQYVSTPDTTPKALDLRDRDAVTVVTGGDDTVDLVIDPSALSATVDENGNGRADDGGRRPIQPGEIYRLTFAFDGRTVANSVGVFEATASFRGAGPGEPLRLDPAPGQDVSADTTLAPGTELTLHLTAVGNDSSFSKTRSVRVRNRSLGLVNATFDLSTVPEATPLSLLLTRGEDVLGATRAEIVHYDAMLRSPGTSESRERLVVWNVTLSDPGFLLVRPGGDDSVVANRYLSAGSHTDVAVSFTRPVRAANVTVSVVADVDGNGVYDRRGPDRPFTRDGRPVTAVVAMPAADGSSGEETTAPSDGGRPGADGRGTASFTPYTLTDVRGPGFGAGAALVALGAAVVVLARRN
ncbi:MAG: BGTF surface domain-containing protein [Haloarculaceae archaeon]